MEDRERSAYTRMPGKATPVVVSFTSLSIYLLTYQNKAGPALASLLFSLSSLLGWH